MATIFAGILGVVVYLYNIVVHGATSVLHDNLLGVLAHYNHTLNTENCIIAVPVIELVGFHLTTDGLIPLYTNNDAVLCLPEPSWPAQLLSFLGMTASYLCFLPHYSETNGSLCTFLKQVPWSWTPACSTTVFWLTSQVTSLPVLTHFDLRSPISVSCNASNTIVGTGTTPARD